MNVNIQSVKFSADEKLISYIENKLSKLTKYNDRIVSMDVFLKLENSGQIKDKVVELKAHLPGNDIFVSDVDKTFEASLDRAVDSLKRQVRKEKEKLKSHR